MKTRFAFVISAWLTVVAAVLAGPRDAEWSGVDEAMKEGRPKTAIERLEPIIAAALAEKAYPEAIKAIGRKIALEGEIQGNKAEEAIARFQVELENAPAEMKPVMEAVLAHWYWQYFQQNRGRFFRRTQTTAAPGQDLQTWDLARILTEIDRHFTAALADEAQLKAIPIQRYDELIEQGSMPDAYRPTLFDFLSYEALQFYQMGEQAAVAAEDEFEIETKSPIFGDAVEFSRWEPAPAETTSPKVKAIRLFQSLLKFHESDSDRSAFFDADLARITYGRNVAVGDDKTDRYKSALERFIGATSRHEISSRALAALADQFNSDGDPARARELAQRALTAFPQSVGADMAINLLQQIEARSARLETEHVWNDPWPTLDVTYRNVTKVFFRAVPFDFDEHMKRSRWGFGGIDREQVQRILATTPALSWDAELPPTSDFKERTEKLPVPKTLKPGSYVIVASHDGSFSEADNQLSAVSIWVSNLAMVLRERTDGASPSGFILEANSGTPVAGATVRLWERDREGWLKPAAPTTTDDQGRFRFAARQGAFVALAEQGGQAVSSVREIHVYGNARRERAQDQMVFFTDRSIYRPGQTINYKGVSIRFDQNAGKYSAVSGRKLTVVFNDPNGQEIARANHTTNDYGSISGVFTAPRDRLMGQMSIQEMGGQGQAGINVEEYKRPKFQVALEAPAEAAKLGAPVSMTGKATAYSGSGIGGAKVKWRIERAVRLPYWCWWWQPSTTKAIAHGTALTDPDGTFKIHFSAEPDRAVPAKNEPVFVFSVHADVTDTTGETRSDQREIRSGYTALQAILNTGEWQTPEKPVAFTLSTTSLDGDPQSAEGKVRIHALKQPPTVVRGSLQLGQRWRQFAGDESKPDPTNPDSWAIDELIAERVFKTDTTGKAQIAVPLKKGIYRALLETKDRFGQTVTARSSVQVVDPGESHYSVKIPNHFTAPSWSVEAGTTFSALWGTGYETGRAFVELESNGKVLKSYWTAADRTQSLIELPVEESMRGGFTIRVTSIRENRAYLNERIVEVPWSNKQLSIKWERFRSKLLPGEKETWTAIITGPDARQASAEMVAALYDASLDQYLPHDWPHAFSVFRTEMIRGRSEFQNGMRDFNAVLTWPYPLQRDANLKYRTFPSGIIEYGVNKETITLMPFSVGVSSQRRGSPEGGRMQAALMEGSPSLAASAPMMKAAGGGAEESDAVGSAGAPKVDLSKVTARKNLNETAFFFPQLIAGADGEVKMVFTMPEALTEWKFIGFAHDAQLRAGFLTDKVVTAKDLMVEPNPPRFVREGDAIEFTVKVSNQSDQPQSGKVKLTFADAATQASMDERLAHRATEQAFDVPAKQSRSYSWRIAVPDGMSFLAYKAVGATATLSDGEEGFLPVLSRRVLVTESLPLPMRGKSTKPFDFKKLLDSGTSDTLRHESLTVQMTSQPAWYAVMALPYLMEFPYECSEQVFNRFYANSLARHIANSDPKIRRIFDLWKNTAALDSPLEKNQEIKSVMLEETPWVRQAKSDNQSRRNVGLLFDGNRLNEESSRALRALSEQQLSEGLWPWFAGGRPSEYISLYITSGFGRLRHLGVEVDVQVALKSLAALDAWMHQNHLAILKQPSPENYVPSYTDALYLYGRSFFLKDQPISGEQQAAVDFFLQQARKNWLQLDSRQSQAHLALALNRFDDKSTAQAIMTSLKDRSVSDAELGMYWRDQERSWWWYRAPIETQTLMIEAFAEVTDDARAVEDCKVWLLKQKQTQDWRTTKATADAIYGLLIRGDKLLASDALVEVALGGQTIKPEKVESGTGFYEKKFSGSELKPAMGRITVKKIDDGVSWGSVHWQYLEDIGKVTPHEGTPLKLKKTLWLKETSGKGQVLKPVNGPIEVGDELVVRLELRADRDMEFVHLKDQRGSGTEPVSVLSQYRYQDGLAYYESTRDTASHFFIDYLPKGVYVFEYSTRVQLKGRYQTGLAEIQCMYAPEFNSHSESILLEIR